VVKTVVEFLRCP